MSMSDKGQPLPLFNQAPAPRPHGHGHHSEPAPLAPGGELLFVVDQQPGGIIARAVGVDLVVEARDPAELRERIQDAVFDRFAEGAEPARIRLHWRRGAGEAGG